jgi:AcrR family transcriptional regulator
MEKLADTLTRRDWVLAALHALAKGGVEAVKVDRLAKDLQVSRGSFYWHFKDRADLLTALLDIWQVELTGSLIEKVANLPNARERLLALAREAAEIDVLGVDNGRAEIAYRQWAAQDSMAATRMQTIDGQRLSHLETELAHLGLPEDRRHLVAKAIYMALLGLYLARGNDDFADDRAYMLTVELLVSCNS